MNLFYTVSTPDADALSCSALVRTSVLAALPGVDFMIVGREEDRSRYPKGMNVFFCEGIKNCWVGNVRYSKSIFSMDYETFTYIDSDILWFAKEFGLSENMYCREPVDISNPWFSFGWDVQVPKGMGGVNSGFFSMDKETAMELSEFFADHVSRHETSLMVDHIKLEQSAFNLYLFKKNYKDWVDKSNLFNFQSDEKSEFSNKKNFHFNKHQLKMNKKNEMMLQFLKNNNVVFS